MATGGTRRGLPRDRAAGGAVRDGRSSRQGTSDAGRRGRRRAVHGLPAAGRSARAEPSGSWPSPTSPRTYEEDGRLVDPASEVARLAEEVLGDLSGQVTTTQDADAPIARGDVLRFVPVVPGIRFNPSALEFQWLRGVPPRGLRVRGRPRARRPDASPGGSRSTSGSGWSPTSRCGSASTAPRATSPQERSRGRVYGKVFPSYSHQDAVVVAQIAAAAQTLGHEYLRDVDQLRAGPGLAARARALHRAGRRLPAVLVTGVDEVAARAARVGLRAVAQPPGLRAPRVLGAAAGERAPESSAARARPVALRLPRRAGTHGPRAHGACTRAGCFAAPVVLVAGRPAGVGTALVAAWGARSGCRSRRGGGGRGRRDRGVGLRRRSERLTATGCDRVCLCHS